MIAAIDPGSEKTGLAVLKEDGVLLIKTIIRTSALETEITDMLDHYDIKTIVMGNGTHHEELRRRTEKAAEAAGYTITVQLVNEKYTTEMGEKNTGKNILPGDWPVSFPSHSAPFPNRLMTTSPGS